MLFSRSLSTGQRGEVYEVNGDQVAVILDNTGNKVEEGNSETTKEQNSETTKEQDAKPSIYWIDSMILFHSNMKSSH